MPKMLTGGEEPKETPKDALRWLLEHGNKLEKDEILKKVAEIEQEMAA